MADYSGYFLQGLSSGIQSGINMGTQLQEMRWQKKQRKELEEKQAKMMEVSNLWNAKIKEIYADNNATDEETAQLTTIYLSGGYEFMEHYQGAMEAIKSMNKAKYDQEKEWMDLFVSGVEGLPPGDIQAMYEYVQPYVTSEKGKNALEAYNNILQKRSTIQPPPEIFSTAEALREKYPSAGVKYTEQGYVPTFAETSTKELSTADKKYNWAIEHHALPEGSPGKISDEQLFKFMGVDVSDPEKRNTIQQRLDEMDKLGATTEEKKNYLLGRTPEKPTPEGEITAGEKRTYDMASSIMFGSSDWVTGISKPGIISTMISNKLNMGQPLTDEEKTEVRNNYNTIKGTLPGEVISAVESQLKRYGIPLEAPKPEIKLPTGPMSKPKQWWEFWKGETPTGTPTKTTPITPEVTPKAGEIPSPKVPTEGKEAMIPLMSKKELEEAIKGLDPSDPLYKLIYDEAVKRGYITK